MVAPSLQSSAIQSDDDPSPLRVGVRIAEPWMTQAEPGRVPPLLSRLGGVPGDGDKFRPLSGRRITCGSSGDARMPMPPPPRTVSCC